MSTMIILLTSEQANQVSGISSLESYSAIEPIPAKNNMFILSNNIINDPLHVEHHDFLITLPQITLEEYRSTYQLDPVEDF